jgi:diaminopropionate ammonia-lyase
MERPEVVRVLRVGDQRAQAARRDVAGMDASSRVLLINTEGATAPGVYAEPVGRPAKAVLDAQRAWLARPNRLQ